MSINKTVVILLALLLAGMAMVPMVSAGSPDKQSDKTPVTLDYAKKVAQVQLTDAAYSLPTFSEWKDAVIENDLTFYDLDGEITAYSFSIVKNKEKQGFILISATRENYPVLESERGTLSLKRQGKRQTRLHVEMQEKNLLHRVLQDFFTWVQRSITNSTNFRIL